MLDAIKDAAVARTVQALRADAEQAGRSLKALIEHPESLSRVDALTAWRLIHGLEASLSVAEETLREARRSPGMPEGPLRRAATDLLSLVSNVKELLESRLIPIAERTYDLPPPGTRWKIQRPG